MKTLFVCFELVSPQASRESVVQAIKSYEHTRLGEFAYLIVTDSEPVEVRDQLKKTAADGDKIFVGASVAPSAWSNMPEAVSKWIISNQTRLGSPTTPKMAV